MEKVWAELKRIEAEAQKMRAQAEGKAKEITALAKQQAEKMVADGKTYGQQEADALYANAVEDANRKRDEQFKENQAEIEKMRVHADKRMDKASTNIVNAVLGEKQL
jgi:vacuolar-type H+-ATPase subunit H